MNTRVVFVERWDDERGEYLPTSEILGYRAITNDGEIIGWGDTPNEARDCLLRILWRLPTHPERRAQ